MRKGLSNNISRFKLCYHQGRGKEEEEEKRDFCVDDFGFFQFQTFGTCEVMGTLLC